MRERSDPLVPILGSAVFVVVILAIGLFYPRVAKWFGPDQPSVTVRGDEPEERVPVWICRSIDGVAILLEQRFDERESRALDRALIGGPHHYLRMTVMNFSRAEPFIVQIGSDGLVSPGGGLPLRSAHEFIRQDALQHLRLVVEGQGAVPRIEVAEGHQGQLLLVTPAAVAERGSFAYGKLLFERRELVRRTLASWQRRPTLKEFLEF